jgi:hypothetical protein
MTPLSQAQALGFAAMTGARVGQNRRQGVATFGFTAPTIIYEEMRAIDQDAARLDGNVNGFVADANFKASWNGWLANWRAFRDRYLDSNAAKLGAVFYTDDLARQVEIYRQQLSGFYADYARQTSSTGGVVPAIAPLAVPPIVPGQKTGPQGESEPLLPWWAWMLIGVGTVGAGYFVYRKYVAAQHTKRTIYREVLPRFIGKPLSRAAEHANSDELPPWAHQAPDEERELADYARDPRALYASPRYHAPSPPPRMHGWNRDPYADAYDGDE